LYVCLSLFGICRSTDYAEVWTAANDGLDTLDVRAMALDLSNTDLLYAATNMGVYRSTDGAESWQQMNEGLTNLDVRTLAVDPLRPNILYAGTWGEGVFVWRTD